jgi:uncharacterized protein (UPF0333 family)
LFSASFLYSCVVVFFMKRGQASVEYILLLAFGLIIVLAAFLVAAQVKVFTDSAVGLASNARTEVLGLLLR